MYAIRSYYELKRSVSCSKASFESSCPCRTRIAVMEEVISPDSTNRFQLESGWFSAPNRSSTRLRVNSQRRRDLLVPDLSNIVLQVSAAIFAVEPPDASKSTGTFRFRRSVISSTKRRNNFV